MAQGRVKPRKSRRKPAKLGYTINIKLPITGRFRKADISVLDKQGEIAATDRVDIGDSRDRTRVANNLVKNLQKGTPEQWEKALQQAHLKAIEERRAVTDQVQQNPPPPLSTGCPEIEVTPEEHIVNNQAIEALCRDTTLFQRSGSLVHILHDQGPKKLKGIIRPANAPRIVIVREASLRERLTAVARFVKRMENSISQVHPPEFCTRAVAARGYWSGIRHLEGVIGSPILSRRHGAAIPRI